MPFKNAGKVVKMQSFTQKPFTLTSSRKGLIDFCLVAGMLLSGFSGYAQQSLVATGGDAHPPAGASGAEVSYSLGQVITGTAGVGGIQINAGVQQPVLWSTPGVLVEGQLRYLNAGATAMTNSQLRLMQGSQLLHSASTNTMGMFSMPSVAGGAYSFAMSTNKPWGGGNATDALLISRHFSVLSPLSGLNLAAADVNNSGVVNSSDALLVGRRAALQLSSFAAGDWMWSPTSVQVGTTGVTMDVRTLCVGDVNGSYTPNVNQRMEMQALGHRGERMRSTGRMGDTIEVYLEGATLELGALTLELEMPPGTRVYGVEMGGYDAGGELIYHQVGEGLMVVWYSDEGWMRKEGETLLRLVVDGTGTGAWRWGGVSELADKLGEVVSTWGLSMPRMLGSSRLGHFTAQVYPNPGKGTRTLSYELPAPGELVLRLSDAAGRLVWTQAQGCDRAGVYRQALELTELSAGSYHLEVLYRSGSGEAMTRVLHLVEYR